MHLMLEADGPFEVKLIFAVFGGVAALQLSEDVMALHFALVTGMSVHKGCLLQHCSRTRVVALQGCS